MIFTIGNYTLGIDVEKNKAYYQDEQNAGTCSCAYCRNYLLAVNNISSDVTDLFDQLGLDLRIPVEVYELGLENNLIFYSGWYHLCGEIFDKQSTWRLTSKSNKNIQNHSNEDDFYGITENFKIIFHKNCALVRKNFPTPCIEMGILAYLPWLLDEPCGYEFSET